MQAYGLVILNHLDVLEREDFSQAALKRSLIANGGFDHRKLFPEYFREEEKETTEALADTANADLDYSEVTWMSPSENAEEFERLMAALNKTSSGVKNGDQVAEASWTEWM